MATVGRADERVNPVRGQRTGAQGQQHRPQRGRHRAKAGRKGTRRFRFGSIPPEPRLDVRHRSN